MCPDGSPSNKSPKLKTGDSPRSLPKALFATVEDDQYETIKQLYATNNGKMEPIVRAIDGHEAADLSLDSTGLCYIPRGGVLVGKAELVDYNRVLKNQAAVVAGLKKKEVEARSRAGGWMFEAEFWKGEIDEIKRENMEIKREYMEIKQENLEIKQENLEIKRENLKLHSRMDEVQETLKNLTEALTNRVV